MILVMQGPLDMFVPSQEQNLRLLGLPISLEKGVMTLRENFTVCEKSEVLTPERAKILEYLGVMMASFSIKLLGHFNKKDGFQQLW